MKKTDFKYYSCSEVSEAIDEYVRGQRNKEICRLALLDGKTYKEIADEFYLSEVAVIKIVRTNGVVLLKVLEKYKNG